MYIYLSIYLSIFISISVSIYLYLYISAQGGSMTPARRADMNTGGGTVQSQPGTATTPHASIASTSASLERAGVCSRSQRNMPALGGCQLARPSMWQSSAVRSARQRERIVACQIRELGLKVPCSYEFTGMGKFALLRYLREFRLRVSSF